MTDALHERLNKILPRVTSDEFIAGRGLGNEVAFHIFDYPPERELEVRSFIPTLLEHIPIKRPSTRVKSVDLFDFVLDHLRERGLLEKALRLQREKGDDALTKALSGPLDEGKLRAPFAQVADSPLNPGAMHTIATGSSGHLGLYRLETQVTSGFGALKTSERLGPRR
jgi:hypothetical protein